MRAKSGTEKCVPSFGSQPVCVQNVLIDMSFNMGSSSLCSWPKFIEQLANRDYNGAANNMASSAGQVGNRCVRNVNIMRSCGLRGLIMGFLRIK